VQAEVEAVTASFPEYQHVIDTYRSETAKTASVWRAFAAVDLEYKPHPKSSSVRDILRHQLLSERRFFAEFLGLSEPAPTDVLPRENSVPAYAARLEELAAPRSGFLAAQTPSWWLEEVPFFEVRRQRIWIFWRRVLHTAHHRTQLTVYLRLLDLPVPSTYGPTADVTWQGADPTLNVDAAGRK
jgi:uncharacterized damage-inducible protein DinB